PLLEQPPLCCWGWCVSLIRDNNDAKTVVEHREMLHCTQEKVHVIQNFIDTGGEDVRCIVVGGECVGCIKRIAGREEWRANVALGGTVEPLSGTEGLELLSELSIKATEAVGAFYAAVDILRSKSEGPLLVNEVNGVPEFKGFMRATGINVGNILVKKILEFIRK
ncbi:MAG: RimK family alpha-L-glutamate ligase, partial [Fervidicoccaceae archaeon]